jgi:hypothetical protein
MDSELEDILALCSVSTKMTAMTLFPERFYAPFAPAIHDKIFELIDSDAPRVAIAAPRGFGKTSIVGLAYTARKILFEQTKFIPYVGTSFDSAVLQTENLKMELASNPMVRKLFGGIKTKTAAEYDETFSKRAWVAKGQTLVYPRGSGQQIRGILYKNARPDTIVIDDLEDADSIDNEEIRRKREQWFFADLVKAVSRLEKNWKIVYIDTLKHEDSLLQKLLESDDWESVRLEACDDNYVPTAPDFMDQETINQEVESHRKKGILDVFYREYRNLPISTEDATFRQEYFRYYNMSNPSKEESDVVSNLVEADIQADRHIESVVILDPAKTVKIHSAESAIVGIGIDLRKARYYVRDIVSEKMYPDEIYDAMFGMATRLKARVIGIEETSLNEFIKQPIKNEMFKRGTFFELVWLAARGGSAAMSKPKRIAQLVPYYRAGHMYHNIACCGGLEAQLLAFPRSKLWDIMDALAYLVELLEKGERYFSPSDDPENTEAEYEDIEYEPTIKDWRYA